MKYASFEDCNTKMSENNVTRILSYNKTKNVPNVLENDLIIYGEFIMGISLFMENRYGNIE